MILIFFYNVNYIFIVFTFYWRTLNIDNTIKYAILKRNFFLYVLCLTASPLVPVINIIVRLNLNESYHFLFWSIMSLYQNLILYSSTTFCPH